MIEKFFIALAMKILEALIKRFEEEARLALVKSRIENEREGTNAINLKKYEGATDRAARIKSALDLLNGTPAK